MPVFPSTLLTLCVLNTYHSSQIFGVAFNPKDDSMVAFASNDGKVHVYQIAARSLCKETIPTLLKTIEHSERSTKVRR